MAVKADKAKGSRHQNGDAAKRVGKMPMTAHEKNAILCQRSAVSDAAVVVTNGKTQKKALADCFDEVPLGGGELPPGRVRPPPPARAQVFGRMEAEEEAVLWTSDTPSAQAVGEITYSNATFISDDDSTRL